MPMAPRPMREVRSPPSEVVLIVVILFLMGGATL